MKIEAYGSLVQHMEDLRNQKIDVPALMRKIEAGGPKMALAIAAIEAKVQSKHIPSRFEPKMMPFGMVCFLEVASPWSGTLDLRDGEQRKNVEIYRGRA